MKPNYRYSWTKKEWERTFTIPEFIPPKLMTPPKMVSYVKIVDEKIESKGQLAIAAKEFARAIRAAIERSGAK